MQHLARFEQLVVPMLGSKVIDETTRGRYRPLFGSRRG
jgi:hypothetical protein